MTEHLGMTARFYNSPLLVKEGLYPLFRALGDLGVLVAGEGVINPVTFYQANQDDEFYLLKLDDLEIVMVPKKSSGRVIFTTILDTLKEKENMALLRRLTTFTDQLFPILGSEFAYVDFDGDSPSGLKEDIDNLRIPWLFWIVYLGESYVTKYGKQFLLDAPVWRTEKLSTGVKYITRESPDKGIDKRTFEMLKNYFKLVGNIRIYSITHFGYK